MSSWTTHWTHQLEHEVSGPQLGQLANERAAFDPEARPRKRRLPVEVVAAVAKKQTAAKQNVFRCWE